MNNKGLNNFEVCVRCMTYNHSNYIEDAMNGFCMQQTSFPFVCCIVDDCSTDGEQEVIKNYLRGNFDLENEGETWVEENENYELKFTRHKKNHNCYFAIVLLKFNHYGNPELKKKKLDYISKWYDNAKYISTCEGDDYWIDPRKLQKQFEILENDETISMCHHNFYDLKDEEKSLKNRHVPQRQDILSIAKFNPTQTLTLFYRNIRPLIPPTLNGRVVYSQFWALRLAEFGDIYYIDEPMAVYRRNPCSIYGTKDAFTKFSMALGNIDNMIYWSKCINRFDVVKILKRRGFKMCFNYFLHFLKRMNPKGICMSIRKACYVYNL